MVQKYKLEIELESDLNEVKLKQFIEDNFDRAFLKINKINIVKENEK